MCLKALLNVLLVGKCFSEVCQRLENVEDCETRFSFASRPARSVFVTSSAKTKVLSEGVCAQVVSS